MTQLRILIYILDAHGSSDDAGLSHFTSPTEKVNLIASDLRFSHSK